MRSIFCRKTWVGAVRKVELLLALSCYITETSNAAQTPPALILRSIYLALKEQPTSALRPSRRMMCLVVLCSLPGRPLIEAVPGPNRRY